MGTKMAVAFANIPCPKIEREILVQRATRLLVCIYYYVFYPL